MCVVEMDMASWWDMVCSASAALQRASYKRWCRRRPHADVKKSSCGTDVPRWALRGQGTATQTVLSHRRHPLANHRRRQFGRQHYHRRSRTRLHRHQEWPSRGPGNHRWKVRRRDLVCLSGLAWLCAVSKSANRNASPGALAGWARANLQNRSPRGTGSGPP